MSKGAKKHPRYVCNRRRRFMASRSRNNDSSLPRAKPYIQPARNAPPHGGKLRRAAPLWDRIGLKLGHISMRLPYACAMQSAVIGDFTFWVGSERTRPESLLSLALIVALT